MLNRGNSKPAEFTFAVPKTNSSSTVEPVAVQSSVTKTVEDESEEPTAISESKTSSKHTVGEDEDVLVAAKEKDEEEKSEPVVQQEEEEEQVENNEPVVEPSPEHKMVAEVSVSPAPAPENTPVAKEESSVKEENAVKESSWVEPENDEVPVFRPQGNTPPQTPSITASPAPPADTPVKENSLRSKWSSRRISPQFAPAEKREPSGSPAPSSSSWSRIPSSSATPEVPVEHPEEMKKAFQCWSKKTTCRLKLLCRQAFLRFQVYINLKMFQQKIENCSRSSSKMFQFTRDTIKNIIYIFCVIRYGPRSGEGVDGRYRRCADGRMERFG